ncbi:MAG: valine--tRNA ligase [Candidatus Paceibacterota bacterium]|jgi:valyl-tRNA synthetase
MDNLEPRYNHNKVEEKIYELWEKSGYFNPDNLPLSKTKNLKPKTFTVMMPPNNSNGSLHIGHAVGLTLQDILIRFWRMKGRKTLWLPGADHAGFETQVVYDKKLDKEGRNRFSIPREELWREIWDFTQENKKLMYAQTKKLGASCDWSRETFTLDPKIIEVVYETFEKLYKDGLVYRDLKIVNWCPKHRTALSDLEVKYIEKEDPLYFIKYGPLTLATVRPETKFGDTGLAVNPKDARYKKYIGKEIEAVGLLGPLKFKVVGDEAVDPKFGTGVVKITPAHDSTDYEIWQRHKNEIPGPKIVIDETGRLTSEAGEFAGLKVAEAREKVAEAMRKIGILEKTELDYKHQIATCYKCGNTLEPLPRPQWFVKTKPLAEKAIKAVTEKKIKIHPKNLEKVYLHWLRNIRDWNISRQIVWGIRIPAWFKTEIGTEFEAQHFYLKSFCEKVDIKPEELSWEFDKFKIRWAGPNKDGIIQLDLKSIQTLKDNNWIDEAWIQNNKINRLNTPGKIFIGKTPPESYGWVQDQDVFDTWFSSGQWPFATLLASDEKSGSSKSETRNPKHKDDFKTFYPTDVMETGYDILFFWVARMVMLGLYRTGKVPFKDVYLHGLVRDKDRQKMSKSKGNVIDPLGVAETYGTDAVRMALTVGNTPGNDIVISEDKIRGYRNFATKIWNASRFVLMNRETLNPPPKIALTSKDKKNIAAVLKIKSQVGKHIEKFEFHLAAGKAYHYFWHTFADKLIEEAKPRLGGEDKKDALAAYGALEIILKESLKMLHPFMPYVTEEIYRKFEPKKILMVEKW